MDFNEKIKKAFMELNKELEKDDMNLTVICAGGFVLSHYGMRTTKDVDGFFSSTVRIEKAIRKVGEKMNLNTEDELWLNNSVQNLNPAPDEAICDKLYELSNLKVLMVPLNYIAGMKLNSARGQDIKDVAWIIRQQKEEDPIAFSDKLKEMGFAQIDESLILEAFGTAYGMEWLEKYYIENENAILDRL